MSVSPAVKGYVVIIAICTFLALVFNIIAVVGPWWGNTSKTAGIEHSVSMTLWKFHARGVVDSEIEWSDFCGTSYVNDKQWCVMVKAARATSILAIVFAFFTLILLVGGMNKLGCLKFAMFTAMLTFVCGVSAIGIGTWYPNNSQLDDPQYGYILLCVGAFFSLISILLACSGYCCNHFSSGFSNFDDSGSSKWGAWKPERKQMPPPALPPPTRPAVPMPRPVVAMPPPPMPLPQPAPIGQKGDFGIAPVGAPAAVPNPMSPSMPQPSGGDFGLGGANNHAIPQPVSIENAGMASGAGRSTGKDFGLDRE